MLLSCGKNVWDGLLDFIALRSSRLLLVAAAQIVVILSAFLLAYALRFDGQIPEKYWSTMIMLLAPLLCIKLVTFWRMGLFAGWWRYVSIPDVITLLKANFLGTAGFMVYIALVHRFEGIPRSIPVLDGILCFTLISGLRVITRIFRENHQLVIKGPEAKKVLMVGAGGVGQNIVKEIRQDPRLHKEVVGFLDNDPDRQRQRFQGVPVLGLVSDLKAVCRKKGVEEVIIAQPAVSSKDLREIVEYCNKSGIRSKILPAMGSIINGDVSIQHIRDVELEDLLGRKAVHLDIKDIQEYLKGKRIFITGAGGSIGSEICRQVAGFHPECIVLFEIGETPLFQIDKELRELFPALQCHTLLGDVRDRSRVEQAFATYRPEVVFHAAAYKHVPMAESNPREVIENNIRGSQIVADTAHRFGTEHFVMISTDKAVNPTNVMGATKRAAEIYVQCQSRSSRTKFVTVRFGNVLGSNGSVIPTFREQIKKGGPVTVTHRDVTRFFMTIPEAVQLVLQAGSMGKGGEIFLLDMGEPVNMLQMAEEMIRLSGLRPYEDIDIVFSGLRPGEKLYEELLLDGEGVMPTRHKKIRVLNATHCDAGFLSQMLEQLYQASSSQGMDRILACLRNIVPEYRPAKEILQAAAASTGELSNEASLLKKRNSGPNSPGFVSIEVDFARRTS
jgi:FlaA1/EpsC-like NDP-sugar epimerase